MEVNDLFSKPALLHAEPVLPVRDVAGTVAYWHKVLGFPGKWTYGEPPNHGGVSWHNTFIQFSQYSATPEHLNGYAVWIRARNLEALYQFHQAQGASIAIPIADKPWGMTEYSVRDPNGYYVFFSAPTTGRNGNTEALPPEVRITLRKPTDKEHGALMAAVGWANGNDTVWHNAMLNTAVMGAVAEHEPGGETIGCGLLLGDGVGIYYVKDVVVKPAWQHKRVGTAIMQAIMAWVDTHAAPNATVGLFTGDHLASFYKQFGFMQAVGMYRQVQRDVPS